MTRRHEGAAGTRSRAHCLNRAALVGVLHQTQGDSQLRLTGRDPNGEDGQVPVPKTDPPRRVSRRTAAIEPAGAGARRRAVCRPGTDRWRTASSDAESSSMTGALSHSGAATLGGRGVERWGRTTGCEDECSDDSV